jgi:hypothetical protein
MLYRIKGTVSKRVKSLNQSNSVDDKGFFIWVDKKTYYLEAFSFRKATIRANKILEHVHEVSQVQGEIAE